VALRLPAPVRSVRVGDFSRVWSVTRRFQSVFCTTTAGGFRRLKEDSMARRGWGIPVSAAACAAVLMAGGLGAQQPPASGAAGQQAPGPGGRGGGRGGGAGAIVFGVADADKDGSVTRDEFKATFDRWFSVAGGGGALTREQLATGLASIFPAPPAGFGGGPQNQTPKPEDVAAMMAALPSTAPAKPARARKVLVLAKAQGFVHSSIPLAAKTVEALGDKTKAWTTTITYNPADITAANLKQYDAVFLDSTTGTFLDDPADAAATAARRAALLEFVRGGKGLAGIHAATDSYHGNPTPPAPSAGGGGGQSGALATQLIAAGDQNSDQQLSKAEFTALADTLFDKIDTAKAGKGAQADFPMRWAAAMPPTGAGRANAAPAGLAAGGAPLWPEFNTMIGGYFKWHWNNPQHITVKIDDPKSPLTAMFQGKSFEINDETYTYAQDSFSRTNVHVLTSIDYAKMSDEDKAKESSPRTDHDYALSWIRRDGQGRVFYEAHGHDEKVYAMTPMLEHVLAGIQYALGDLKADDSPTVKGAATAGK
jgi:type 1 glutamine amidotransferase